MTPADEYAALVMALVMKRPDETMRALRGLAKCAADDARELVERDRQLAEVYADVDAAVGG